MAKGSTAVPAAGPTARTPPSLCIIWGSGGYSPRRAAAQPRSQKASLGHAAS